MSDEGTKTYRAGQFKPGDPNNPRRRQDATGSGINKNGKNGRPDGSPNSATIVKRAVLGAFDRVGAEDYLVKCATSKKTSLRTAFLQLLAKAMPTEITGKDGGPIDVQVLHIATEGIARLTDEELAIFVGLLDKIGVTDIPVLVSANDESAQALLAAPKADDAPAAAAGASA